jgi:sporulation protein YlmC with PRC-barrel domain
MRPLSLALAWATLIIAAWPAAAEEPFIAEQTMTQYLVKDRLLGANVQEGDGKIVGHIEDLIIDSDRQIVGAVIGVGGLLGIAEKKIAVPITALSLEMTDGKMSVILPVTKDALVAAPAFKRVNPPKGILQRAVERGRELKDKSKDVYDAAKVKAGPAFENAKAAAAKALETAKEEAGPALAKAREKASQVIENAKPTVPQATQADPPKN